MTKCVSTLPEVTKSDRALILSAPRIADAHRKLLADIPAMNMLEQGGEGSLDQLPSQLSIAAWNVERCLFPQKSAKHLADHKPLVVLLSEMDNGMARTAQANTTAQMAAELGMHYAYGVEFFELGLGGPTERHFCKDEFNSHGWHGNAILSAAPFERLAMLRLDQDGHWFSTDPGSAADPDQPRLGGRMAIFATIPTQKGSICVVSTHLESNASVALRHQQFEQILDFAEEFAPDLPVLIGGDLNTGNHIPPDYDWRAETLFELAYERGYRWDFTASGITTRHSLITPHDTRRMKLDWFCARGFTGHAHPLLASLDEEGTPLSDHEAILCTVSL